MDLPTDAIKRLTQMIMGQVEFDFFQAVKDAAVVIQYIAEVFGGADDEVTKKALVYQDAEQAAVVAFLTSLLPEDEDTFQTKGMLDWINIIPKEQIIIFVMNFIMGWLEDKLSERD